MASKTVSKQGLMEIIQHEAIVQTRYKDSAGVWTIGVGHTKSAGAPDPKTFTATMAVKDVLALFKHDLRRYEKDVNDAVTVALEQHEFDALVSFHFNTGGIKKASLTDSINAGDKAKAAEQFLNWSKPPEIIPRRPTTSGDGRRRGELAAGHSGNDLRKLKLSNFRGTAMNDELPKRTST